MDRKPISPRKRKANRRNSKRSTGPRTKRGKSRSRWNSLKLGLTAKLLVLRGYESRKQYTRLLKALRKELHPTGSLADMRVEQLAVARWAWLRYLRVERNEVLRATEQQKKEFMEELEEAKEKGEKRGDHEARDYVALPDLEQVALMSRYGTTLYRRLERAMKDVEPLEKARRKRARRRH